MKNKIELYNLKDLIEIAYDESNNDKIGFYLTINNLIDYYYNDRISVGKKKEIENKYNLKDKIIQEK